MVQTVCAEEPNNGQSNDTRRVIALVVAIVQLYMMDSSEMKLLWMLANWQRLGFLIVKNIVQDNRMDDPTMLSMSVGQRIENWWRQLGIVDILCKYIDQMVRLCLCVCVCNLHAAFSTLFQLLSTVVYEDMAYINTSWCFTCGHLLVWNLGYIIETKEESGVRT